MPISIGCIKQYHGLLWVNAVKIFDADDVLDSPWRTDRCGEEHAYMCETGLTGN